MKTFDGTFWPNFGAPRFSPGFTKYVSLELDPGGLPVVAFVDGANGDRATVMRYA